MAFVRLVDHMGGDDAIVQAARVSYGKGTKTISDDRGLIRYLMRHRHTTPFEMVEFKFHVRAPIFVARQWMRHRTASVNELSARYSIVRDDFFVPSEFRSQSISARQSSEGSFENPLLRMKQKGSCDLAFHTYDEMLRKGVARELARMHLPQNTYTEFYWKMNLHNLFHFLELRMSPDAQQEIRELASDVYTLIRPFVPIACEAFQDYVLDAVTLSGPEVRALKSGSTDNLSPGERCEFDVKKSRLV